MADLPVFCDALLFLEHVEDSLASMRYRRIWQSVSNSRSQISDVVQYLLNIKTNGNELEIFKVYPSNSPREWLDNALNYSLVQEQDEERKAAIRACLAKIPAPVKQ